MLTGAAAFPKNLCATTKETVRTARTSSAAVGIFFLWPRDGVEGCSAVERHHFGFQLQFLFMLAQRRRPASVRPPFVPIRPSASPNSSCVTDAETVPMERMNSTVWLCVKIRVSHSRKATVSPGSSLKIQAAEVFLSVFR